MKAGLLLALLAASLAACTSERVPLVATDVAVNKPLPGTQMSAGYLTLTNNTEDAITITAVSSPEFGSVEMHETVLEDGVSRMRRLAGVEILPGASVIFEPGGKHLMLMRPGGDVGSATLEFHSGDSVLLTLSVPLGD